MSESHPIENVLHEIRHFEPSQTAQNRSSLTLEQFQILYRESLESPETFWPRVANELHWFQPWTQLLEWQEPFASWFVGAKTNLCYNAVDQHLERRAKQTALIWESEQGEVRTLSYLELHQQVCRLSNALERLGVVAGDVVMLYLPHTLEAAISMLACARIGAIHSVIFGGFSPAAIADRINDAQAKILITADGGFRKGGIVPLKHNADQAALKCPSLEQLIVLERTGQDVPMQLGRDLWWHDLMAGSSDKHVAKELDSEHPLFILYTSGSTGKPKGVLHTTGGYMVGAYLSTKTVFDLKHNDIFWCTADVGWITGHTYTLYGPLLNGSTSLMYEGAPNHPDFSRFWQIIEKHKVTVFYTAPTAIRAFMRAGDHFVEGHDLSSLRLLGSVGEPINPEAWVWYYHTIGGSRCPVVDTWWQTETGSIMLTTLPGVHSMKPGSAGVPMFGVEAAIVNEEGVSLEPDQGGLLVLKRPWPSMMRGIYGDLERYKKSYWGIVPKVYLAGDGARMDQMGYFTIVGRIDDVLNVSGHRLGTMELESALVEHPAVAEAAVVGRPDPIKGEGIVAFVLLQADLEQYPTEEELKQFVANHIGAIARPDQIRFADALPKTRSGKIMRRFLRQIAAGEAITGDTSTLEDPSVLERLKR
jgi:acetyl-CoA synthetase